MSSRASNQPTSVAVAVCTYERNGPLEVLLRALVRLAKGRGPQLRYCMALALLGIGQMIGPLGIRVGHP
jgi:hypothetical protein